MTYVYADGNVTITGGITAICTCGRTVKDAIVREDHQAGTVRVEGCCQPKKEDL